MTNFRFFQPESLQTKILKFDGNSGKLSKQAENTVGRRDIATDEQILRFPQSFRKTYTANR